MLLFQIKAATGSKIAALDYGCAHWLRSPAVPDISKNSYENNPTPCCRHGVGFHVYTSVNDLAVKNLGIDNFLNLAVVHVFGSYKQNTCVYGLLFYCAAVCQLKSQANAVITHEILALNNTGNIKFI